MFGYAIYTTNRMRSSPFVVNFLLGVKTYFLSALLLPYILPTIVDPVTHTHITTQLDQSVFYWGLLYSILFGIAETLFILGIVLSENIGLTIMLGCLTVLMGYAVSIIKYNEEINTFCLFGAIFILVGLSRIVMAG